jgi:peptidoglycan/xylan/chitin deacetylase (PgdA/CDA1 family)
MAGCGGDDRTSKWVNPVSRLSAKADSLDVTHGPRDKPAVALTFHGEGDEAQARALLDELERGGARVTVLAVGSWLAAQPTMASRILDGGHELGNHSQNHLAMADMGAADVFNEINDCAEVLKRLTGSIGRWFRPSATQYATDTIRAQAARVGYSTCLSYDVDSLDFTDPDPAEVVRTLTDTIGNGSIVSMHFGHAATVAAIPEVLDRLRQRGLRPVTMTELMT